MENDFKSRLAQLFAAQERYDLEVAEQRNHGRRQDVNRIRLGLMDEVGEALHETKPVWVYWKENPGEVDMAALKEELADIMHFQASCMNHLERKYTQVLDDDTFVCPSRDRLDTLAETILGEYEFYKETEYPNYKEPGSLLHDTIFACFKNMSEIYGTFAMHYTFILAWTFGISPDEMLDAYFEKNAKNWDRLRNHY